MAFPGGSDSKESACNTGDLGSIPGSGRSPGEGNGYPLQYSCPENSMDKGTWWSTVHGVVLSQTRLSDFNCFSFPVLISLYLMQCNFIAYFSYHFGLEKFSLKVLKIF